MANSLPLYSIFRQFIAGAQSVAAFCGELQRQTENEAGMLNKYKADEGSGDSRNRPGLSVSLNDNLHHCAKCII